MTFNKLESLRRLLTRVPKSEKRESVELSKPEVRNLKTEVIDKAKDLHTRLGMFHDLLTGHFEGRVDLGTDVESINWDAMPQGVAACFKPEFSYQPDEITAFFISSKDNRRSNGRIGTRISLERINKSWSEIQSGAIARERDGYHSGVTFISCKAPQAQPKEAREAMKSLDDALRRRDLNIKDSALMRSLEELNFTESVLEFATSELERHMPDQTS